MINTRQSRIESDMRKLLSEVLLRKISDPQLQNVTFTSVKVTPDISLAKIYFNYTDSIIDSNRRNEILKKLLKRKGVFRAYLAEKMKIRKIPKFNFYYDDTLDHADRINELLKKI